MKERILFIVEIDKCSFLSTTTSHFKIEEEEQSPKMSTNESIESEYESESITS